MATNWGALTPTRPWVLQELQLTGYQRLYSLNYFSQPATPHIDLPSFYADPTTFAAAGRAPYAKLPLEDIALLDADPALRSRYCELALT